MPSDLEILFANKIDRLRLPAPLREYRFAAGLFGRQWRFDFCWPQYMLAVELHGIVECQVRGRAVDVGGHGTIVGKISDMNKYNAAILLGWKVLTFAQAHVNSTEAMDVTQRALIVCGWNGVHLAHGSA